MTQIQFEMEERIRPSPRIRRFPGLLITNIILTDKKLGRGADATVYEVDWNGTPCAAKRLHEILLEDNSPGGADKFVANFETECMTWSKLRHPGVVQFLGVYLERGSRLPILVIEKMDTSLRRYLEDHSKKEFSLHLKAFVLRQISQALAYLHGQNPPLVHHDLSPNNVLLNVVSFVTKLTDFGMSRAINPSSIIRKSSIKGTPAFMSPEALQNPPRYNEKLDVFSFGSIILSILTHEWPEPDPPTQLQGDQLVALNELQRRERYVEIFTAQEKQLFLPTVCQCLENRPDKRPSSAVLVRELRHIESSLSSGSHVVGPIEQLQQQLSAKEEECRQKDEALREKDEALREKTEALMVKDEALKEKDEALREKDETLSEKDKELMEKDEALRGKDEELQMAVREKVESLLEKDEALKEKDDMLIKKNATIRDMQENVLVELASNQAQRAIIQVQQDTIQVQQAEIERLRKQPALAKQAKHRDWRKLGECQKVIQQSTGGGFYYAVAVNSEGLLAVTEMQNCVHLLTNNGTLVRSFGEGVLSGGLFGVLFDLKGNVWVTDYDNSKVVNLSQDGRFLQTICHASSESDCFSHPRGVTVSVEGLISICDSGNNRVTVHDEEGKFMFAFGSKGSGPGCFDRPFDIAFGSDGLMYVVDRGNKRVSVWSKQGTFKRQFKPKYDPFYIAATNDNHLLITSNSLHTVMVYTLEGELIHQFGAQGSDPGRFNNPWGICVDDNELVYVVDYGNNRVQVF